VTGPNDDATVVAPAEAGPASFPPDADELADVQPAPDSRETPDPPPAS